MSHVGEFSRGVEQTTARRFYLKGSSHRPRSNYFYPSVFSPVSTAFVVLHFMFWPDIHGMDIVIYIYIYIYIYLSLIYEAGKLFSSLLWPCGSQRLFTDHCLFYSLVHDVNASGRVSVGNEFEHGWCYSHHVGCTNLCHSQLTRQTPSRPWAWEMHQHLSAAKSQMQIHRSNLKLSHKWSIVNYSHSISYDVHGHFYPGIETSKY